MEKKQKKIHALMQGQTIPFNALFIIRVWDKSKDGLNAKASAIKNAINSINSAQYFESNLPSTSKNLFFQTWPGWTWGRYEHRKLYSEHRFLADMLPVTSTFTGHLKTAEAIYNGPHNNLVGIETFTATAHKLARLIYRLIKHGENYVRQGLEDYERKFQERKMHGLKKTAMMMGFDLVPKQATTPAVS